ncbi:MAG: agmatinase [Pseudomonadota bacterium]
MTSLTEPPPRTFLEFPMAQNLDHLEADIAFLGIPYGMPYAHDEYPNDQSKTPDALRTYNTSVDIQYTKEYFDFDLGGPLLGDKNVRLVDCGNVTVDFDDPGSHFVRAEAVARKIFSSGAQLITIGGDHGIPIPVLRALEVLSQRITLVPIDAHLDWRDEIDGEHEGYSSPIRRASEMNWVGDIIQIGMRGIGSARTPEVEDAKSHGCRIITAYEMHDKGIDYVLGEIPAGGPYYLTIDADGVDPTIMPGVMAQTPGGLDWIQLHQLIHGLSTKGPIVGMDLVEIAPSHDLGNTTLIHAERLICNFIGASVRSEFFQGA